MTVYHFVRPQKPSNIRAPLAAEPAPDTYDELVATFVPNVISYWKFEVPSGTTVTDVYGTENATITGLPERSVETIVDLDRVDEGAAADGTVIAWTGTGGEYAQAADDVAHKTAEGTIIASFQCDTLSEKSTLVAADAAGAAGGLAIEVNTNGSPRAYLRNTSGVAVVLTGTAGNVQLGQAYTMIFKWGADGLSLSLWNDAGVLLERQTNPSNAPVSGTSAIRFGAWHTDISHHDGPYGRVIWLNRRITNTEEETLARARTIVHSGGGGGASVALPAAIIAFQTTRVRVTTLPGWPAGRTPASVIAQGTHAHGYVRRAWKTTDNDGTYMDFQAGWRKTLTADTIRVLLDNGSEATISYTVSHALPTPGTGGATRTLDKLGGADFTTWTAAIQACQANDVLVVRARAGGEVYPQDDNGGGPVGAANGVYVVAHPDDLAAGRRPRIHVGGTKFAKFADELNAGHWVIDTALGGSHGNVWKSAVTISNPVNVGCSYRTKRGTLRRCYTYTNTAGTPGALARLRDTSYPRIAVEPDTLSGWDLYQGPGIYWHSTDQKLYIRLSPLRDGVGAIQVDKTAGLGPTPPWDWTDDNPFDEDPNKCQLYISSSNNQNSAGTVTTETSYIVRINGRTNWTFENLDFISGGNGIEMRDGGGHILRGCRFLGWAPPNMEDDPNQSTIGQTHAFLECENTSDVLSSRCEYWGGCCPWVGWDENKIRHGAYSIPQKSNLYWFQGSPSNKLALRFVNCLLDGFLVVSRPAGIPNYLKWHHCRLQYWGMDGSLVHEPPQNTLEYIRCQLFEFTFAGWANGAAHQGRQYVGYSMLTNVRPFLHENGWWNTNTPQNNEFVCGGSIIGHESYKDCLYFYFYNNTSIGAHHHRGAPANKNSGGSAVSVTHDGNGASIFPYNRPYGIQEWWSRNNICAVRPNGSQGSCNGTTGAPSTTDSHVGLVFHPNHIGWQRTNPVYSQNYNLYHRASNMPNTSFAGVLTTINSGTTETARSSITDVRADTGQEQNGRIADPLFTGAWASSKLDREIHQNAFWCLQSGSPAASGGDTTDRTWIDMDFGTQVNYLGNSWLGCMDPLASAVEQQVGILGPTISQV